MHSDILCHHVYTHLASPENDSPLVLGYHGDVVGHTWLDVIKVTHLRRHSFSLQRYGYWTKRLIHTKEVLVIWTCVCVVTMTSNCTFFNLQPTSNEYIVSLAYWA